MRLNSAALRAAAVFLAATAVPSFAQTTYIKAANTTALNTTGSWTVAGVPGVNDTLKWDSTVTTTGTSAALGGNLSIYGLEVTNPGGAITVTYAAGNTLTLGAGGINMSAATQNLNLLYIASSNAAANLAIGANQQWNINAGRTLTLFSGSGSANQRLTGSANIEKLGAGTVLLFTGDASNTGTNIGTGDGNDTYTGNWTITAGKVQAMRNASHAWGQGTINLNGGTIAQVNGNWTWSNNITVAAGSVIANDSSNGLGRTLKLTGSITSSGGSTLTFTNNITGGTRNQDVGFILAGANASTYGDTVISANSRVRVGGNATNSVGGDGLQAGARGSLGTGAVTLSAATSELAFTRSDSHTVANAISGSGTVVIGGTTASLLTTSNNQVVTFTGANTYSGATTIAIGTLQVGDGGTVGTLGSGAVTNAGSLIFNRSDALAVANVISGAGSVTKTGAGTLTLSGNNAYTGGTTIAQGAVVVTTSANALGTGGTVTLNTAATGTSDTSLFLNGSLNLSRAITVANQGTGTTTIGASSLAAGNQAIFSGAIALNKDVTLQGTSVGDRTQFSGGISGTGNVTVSGTGRVVLVTTANTYSGSTTLSAGAILQLSDATATSASLIPDASVLTMGAGSFLKLSKGANGETIGGLAGSGTVRGHESVASIASALTVANAGDYSFGGVLEDGGASGSTLSLTKSGAGNQTLTGTSTFTGGTTISAGTLTLGHATDTLANAGAVTVSGGTLALGSNSDTIGALSLTSGSITGTGTLTTSGATLDLASDLSLGVILGGGALTKQGVGVLTLTAANTYTGATTVSAGTLNLASGASLDAASALSLASGATLTGTGTASGAVTLASGAILSPGASNVGTLSLGSLTFGAASGDTATIQFPVSFGGTLDSALSVGGNIVANGGAGSVTFALGANLALLGSGTYSLVAYTGDQLADVDAFAYTGTTGARQSVGLTNGTKSIDLTVGNAFVIWSGSQGSGWSTADNWSLSSNNSAASYLTNDVVVFNDAASTGTVDLSANVQASTVTFSGDTRAYTVGSGNGSGITAASLAKQGGATVTLNTANTITDGVAVSGGTLVLGNAGALGASSVSLTGGTLDLNGLAIANNIVLGGGTLAGNGATLSGAISEAGGARSLEVGSDLTLTGSNTYTGGTTVSAGTLQVGAGGTTGTLGSGTVTNNAALVFSRSDSLTVANAISGTGALTQSGAGTLILTGGNSYGATTVSNGTLQVGANGAAGTLGSGAVTNNAALVFSRSDTVSFANDISGTGTVANSGSGTVTLSGAISSAGALTQSGAGTLVLTGANTYGATTVSNGTLQVGANGAAGTLGSGAVTNNAALVFSRSDTVSFANDISGTGTVANSGSGTVTLSGAISSAGALTQSGAGTLVLTGANTYGATTISGGTLQVGAGGTTGTLGSGAVTLSNSAALAFNRSDNLAVSNAISGVGSLTKSGNGTLTLSVANSYSGGTTLSAGTVQLGHATALGTAGVTVASGATLNVAGFGATNALTLNGSGNGSNPALWNSASTFTSLGSVTLGSSASVGNSTNDKNTSLNLGATNLAGNTLTIASGAVSINIRNFSSGDIIIANGGTFYTDNGTNTYAAPTGTITINAGGRMETRDTDNTAQTSSHTIALNGGTLSTAVLANNNGGGAGTILRNAITVDAANGGSIVGNNTAFLLNLRLTGAITGSGALAISGAQGVELRGDLSGYTGTATVTEGTLTFNPSANTTFGGTLAGARPIAKSGANTLTFGSAQTYTGTTTVSAGTLALSGAGDISASSSVNLSVSGASLSIASASGGRTVANLAGASGSTIALGTNALTVSSGSNTTFSGAISGDGSLVKNGAATLTLGAASTFTGGATLNAGAIQLANGSALGTGTVALKAGATLTADANLSVANAITLDGDAILSGTAGAGTQGLRLNGVIGGSSGFTKTGAGRVSLANNANTFTGAVTVTAGLLAIGNGGLSTASSVSLNGGGIALGEGNTTTFRNLSGNSSVSYITGNFGLLGATSLRTLAIDQSVDGTYAGSFETSTGGRTISLVKQGSATLTFTSIYNLYVGSTTVSAGTLRVGDAGRINAGAYAGAIDIASGATFHFDSSAAQTLSGAISNAGTLRKSGAGTLTLSGISSFGGAFAIDAGRVILTDNNNLTAAITVASGATLQVANNGTAGTLGNGATVVNSGAIEWNRSNETNVSTALSGSGTLTKLGAGILSLNGDNDISGTVTITAGTLRLGAGGTGGSIGSGEVVNDATLSFNRTNTLTLGNLISGTGAVSQIGTGATILTADNTYSGATTISAGTLQVGAGGTTGTLGSGAVTNDASLVFNRSDALAVGNDIGGTGSLTQSGAGILTLGAANTFSGGVTVQSGTLVLGNLAGFGTGTVTLAGGTLDLGGLAPTNLILISGGSLANASAWLAANTPTLSGDVDAAVINNLPTTELKVAAGANINLNGVTKDIVFEGGTLANLSGHQGKLKVKGSLDLSSEDPLGEVEVAAGGTVDFGSRASTKTVKFTGGSVAGANFTGDIEVVGTGITLGSAIQAGRVRVTSGNSAAIDSGFTRDIAFAGGSLSGLANYSGTVSLETGATLSVGDTTSADFALASGSTLKGSGSVGTITQAAGSVLAPGNSPGLLTTDSLVLGGGASLEVEFFAATGTRGTDYDAVTVTGALDLSGLSVGNRYTLSLVSLSALPSTQGPLAGFDAGTAYIYELFNYATLTMPAGYTGNIANLFTLDTSSFQDSAGNAVTGGFTLFKNEATNMLELQYAPIPEPSTYGLVLGALALAGAAVRRRKKTSK